MESERDDHPMPPKTLRIFISHLHLDDDQAFELGGILRHGSDRVAVSVVISSRALPFPMTDGEIRDHILIPRLRWANLIIVLVTDGTELSKWVRWEIDYAAYHHKRIIGVVGPFVESPHSVWLRQLGYAVTFWDRDAIFNLVFLA